jgi:cellulose biosynthesis protein BcsQ
MISAVVYSESGGTYKTTTTANLAVALSRMGLKTLVIDLDPQKSNLSSLLGAGEHRNDPEADNLVKHILEMPDGSFDDLIETTDEGVDIVPSHDMLSDFTSNLEQKISYETGVQNINREEYPRYELLYRLLWEREELHEEYDAILIDPNARAEDLLFNAIFAMRTLVAPISPSGKGSMSLEGLEGMVQNLETQLGIEVGLACLVPSGVKQRSNAHQGYLRKFVDSDQFATPVVIGDRESVMNAMWEAEGSVFKVIEERWKTCDENDKMKSEPGKRRVRDREIETLRKYHELAFYLATSAFDMDVDPVLRLEIQDAEPREFNPQADVSEVSTA